MMGSLVENQSALLLLAGHDQNVEKSARNLVDVKTLQANYLNIRDLLGYDKVVMPLSALEVVSGFLASDDSDWDLVDDGEEE